MRFTIVLIFLFLLLRMGLEAEEDSENPIRNKLIELVSSSTNSNARGQETIGSLLSSMRLANSLISGSELFRDRITSNQEIINSKIIFSQKFTDISYSVSLGTGSKVNYNREILGNQGTFIQENVTSNQNLAGVKIGVGLLNYLSPSSSEFSLGFESLTQSGPFQTLGYKEPKFSYGELQNPAYLLGQGSFRFNANTMSLKFGFNFTGDLLGVYGLTEFQFASAKSALNSVSQYSNSSFLGGADTQIALLKLNNIFGIVFLIELGAILKFTDNLGIKFGGYYQFAYFTVSKPSGYYYENAKWNEASSATQIVSALTRNDLGFYGINFGIINSL